MRKAGGLVVTVDELVDIWRKVIVGDGKSWVLFTHGTCVVVVDQTEDLAGRAVSVLREHGPVQPSGPAGDFSTIELDPLPGWVVTFDHPDVLTYVAPEDVSQLSAVVAGLTGRAKTRPRRPRADRRACRRQPPVTSPPSTLHAAGAVSRRHHAPSERAVEPVFIQVASRCRRRYGR
jgi:hypothetical protein